MLIDLYSKRRKRERDSPPDVFLYDELPHSLRVQVVHIMREAITLPQGYERETYSTYEALCDVLHREYGVFSLQPEPYGRSDDPKEEIEKFFLTTPDVERALDVIELVFRYVMNAPRGMYSQPAIEAHTAIDELNTRFREHAVGYQFEEGEIIRVDSQLLNAQAVKPALALLRERAYEGANAEFLSAYEHYRHGRNKEALNEALKSVESTLKTICGRRGWSCHATDTAKRLIEVCFNEGLVPDYMQSPVKIRGVRPSVFETRQLIETAGLPVASWSSRLRSTIIRIPERPTSRAGSSFLLRRALFCGHRSAAGKPGIAVAT
jgi:hypothetical protein